jgi:hypothetical protein
MEMTDKYEGSYQTSDSAVYREVGNELVVIQVDTGHFYYFNQTTKQFLDFFRHPAKLDDFITRAGLTDDEELGYLKSFLGTLKDKRILEASPGADEPSAASLAAYSRPALIREGEKKLDEIASEIAVLTTGGFL